MGTLTSMTHVIVAASRPSALALMAGTRVLDMNLPAPGSNPAVSRFAL